MVPPVRAGLTWEREVESSQCCSPPSLSTHFHLKCLDELLSRNKNDNSLLFLLFLCSHNRLDFH